MNKIAIDRLLFLDDLIPIIERKNYEVGCKSVAIDKSQCNKNADIYFKNNDSFWKKDLPK